MTPEQPTPDLLARAERLAKEALKARPHLYRGRRTWALEQCTHQALDALAYALQNEPDKEAEEVDVNVLDFIDEWLYESTHS